MCPRATWVLTGHSERRTVMGESDKLVAGKTKFALDSGMRVTFCIGENLEQRESGQMEGGEVNYEDIWSKAMQDAGLEGAWGDGAGAMDQAWGGARADPNAYAMEEENKYRDKEGMFDRGMELFQAGEIEEAVLAFQAHIQKHPEDCSESWRMLGSCHQEQDEDRRAIISLEKAVEQDPYVARGLVGGGRGGRGATQRGNRHRPQGA